MVLLIELLLVTTLTDVTADGYTSFVDNALYLSSDWTDKTLNLIADGIPTKEECYRVCQISNGGYCNMFRYESYELQS